MSSYVLVAGAWLGAWAWNDVAIGLDEAGHAPYPVTLTGLGETADLADPAVDLDTHISDVSAVLDDNDLHDVVLVGHSYGGAVVGGVAERMPERLARVVYVDSGPLPHGASYMDVLTPDAREFVEDLVTTRGAGWMIPMPSWDEFGSRFQASTTGLGDRERAVMRRRATPQPVRTWTQPLHRRDGVGALAKTLVTCSFPLAQVRELTAAGHPWFAELADPSWTFAELPTGHWPMFSRPRELAQLLARYDGVRSPSPKRRR